MSRSAILAHGKNWELPVPSDPADIRLSLESEITAEAAGTLFVAGIGDVIIFSTGHTAGSRYPSEASKMREAMYSHFTEDEVPFSKTILEEESYDTAGNLAKVKERMTELDVDRLILLSIGFHLPRVRRLARVLDVPVSEAYRSDYVIRQRHSGVNYLYARAVIAKTIGDRSLKPLLRTASAYGLEAAGWGLSLVDPEGKHIAGAATAKIRHQK